MNAKQLSLYRHEWAKARRKLRSYGVPPKEADARRKQIHIECGAVKPDGSPKSSTDLTNAEFTRVLAAIRLHGAEADLDAQLAADSEEQALIKARWKARELAAKLGIPEPNRPAYLDGIAKQMFKCRFDFLTAPQLHKLIAALNYQHRRNQTPSREHAEEDPF